MSYGQWLLKCRITLFQPKQWKTAVKNLGCFGHKYAVHHNTVPPQAFLVGEGKAQKRERRMDGMVGPKLIGWRYGDIEHRYPPSIPLLGTSPCPTAALRITFGCLK